MPRNGSGVMSKPAGTTFVPNTTIESSKVNTLADDIIADLNAARPITAGGTGATSAAGARANLGLTTGTFGFLYGLTLSNNTTDAANDIDIAAGTAAEGGVSSPALMTLASTLTKRLDAAWAVGSGNGGLDTGTIANTTYHVFLIQRSDTGVVDALFSTSATSPTMPTNYDRKRRIGSIIRSSGAILAFTQIGKRFLLSAAVDARSSASAASSILLTLEVPNGIKVRAIFQNLAICSASSDVTILAGDGDSSTAALQLQRLNASSAAGASDISNTEFLVTNTSRQIRYTAQVNAGSFSTNVARCLGWYDDFTG